VDRDAASLGDVANHQVPGHRLAALRIPHHQPVHALDLDAAAEPQPLDHATERRRLGRLQVFGREVGYSARIMVPSAMSPRPSAACSCSAVPTESSVAALEALGIRGLEAPSPHLPREDLLAELQALLVLLAADPLPDLVARPAVCTWASQSRDGLACGLVITSTVSPFFSGRCSGAMRPLMRAP